jgi:hypothetical protein
MYNAYTIPIRNVSLLFETGNLRHLSKFWMPKFLLIRRYKNLINQYNAWFNKEDKKKISNLADSWYVLKLKNKAVNLLPNLYYALVWADDSKARELYKELYGKYPEKEEGYNKIINEITTLNDKLSVLDNTKDEKEGISFSDLIPLIELSRDGIVIDRTITLFEFYKIYKTELEKHGNSGD